MAKTLELTIDTNYLPTWATWEGIRELVQNGKDAETEHHAALTVDWKPSNIYKKLGEPGQTLGILRIENEGVKLPHEALLLGNTSKADRTDTIGRFGEGLKLGILALVRKGVDVTIRSGDEVWTPSIVESSKFKANVLAFRIEDGRENKNRVRVEIGPVEKETWALIKKRFLFLTPVENSIKTASGTLLLDEEYKGHIYVKGIYVNTDSRLQYGYDFTDAQLDRDRKMVDSWDLSCRTRGIWSAAVNQRPDLVDKFLTLAEGDTQDVTNFEEWSASRLDKTVLEAAAKIFTGRHGAEAVPVDNLADGQALEHLGRKGVVVPKQVKAILAQTLGTAQAVIQKMEKEVSREYSWSDIEPSERENLTWALHLLSSACPSVGINPELASLAHVHVVDFRSDTLMGQYKDGKPYVARNLLKDAEETLGTLLHELAHTKGGDGDKGHVFTMECMWVAVTKAIRAGVK